MEAAAARQATPAARVAHTHVSGIASLSPDTMTLVTFRAPSVAAVFSVVGAVTTDSLF